MENKPIEVKYFHAMTGRRMDGTQIVPSASLEVLVDGKIIRASSHGKGPIHAVYNAINSLPIFDGARPYLMNFELNSVKQGADSAGTAWAKVIFGSEIYEGVGRSDDVVEAALYAYVDAINKHREANQTIRQS